MKIAHKTLAAVVAVGIGLSGATVPAVAAERGDRSYGERITEKAEYSYLDKCDFSLKVDPNVTSSDQVRVSKKVKKKVRKCVKAQEKMGKRYNPGATLILTATTQPSVAELATQQALAKAFAKAGCREPDLDGPPLPYAEESVGSNCYVLPDQPYENLPDEHHGKIWAWMAYQP